MKLKTLAAMEPWEWPADTGKKLLAVLRDGEAPDADRRLAVEMAGELVVMNDALAEALLATARNAGWSDEVRARAAISLGAVLEDMDLNIDETDPFEQPPISNATFEKLRTSLRQLYQDATLSKELRRRVLEASVRSPQDWHVEAIRAAYRSGDGAWKLTAVFCMRFVQGFAAEIAEALDSEDAEVLREAVLAAGSQEVKGAWEQVKSLLTSPDTEKSLLLAAIDAAPGIDADEAVEVLETLAEADDEDVAVAVEEAMAMARGLADFDEEAPEDPKG